MNRNFCIGRVLTGQWWLGLAGALAVVTTVWAGGPTNTTTRTTALLTGAAQRPLAYLPGIATNALPQIQTIDVLPIAGHVLVNLALGRDIGSTNAPNQVLALTIPCDLSAARLVIFDQATSNTITIATSLRFDSVHSPVTPALRAAQLGTTNEIIRFITRLQVVPAGNASNALLSGELTVAGRVHRDSVTGCLAPVPVAFDVDRYDHLFLDTTFKNVKDKDLARATSRTGLAHVIGQLQLVSKWQTNTVLVPAGNLSIRRDAEIIK